VATGEAQSVGPRSILGNGEVAFAEDSVSEAQEGPRTVKVVDRRMFSADGTPREDLQPEERAPEQPAGSAGQVSAPRPERPTGAASAEAGRIGQSADDWSWKSEPRARHEPLRDSRSEATGQAPRTPSATAPPSNSQSFLELVAMLARNAELLLVGSDGVPAQPDEARRVIDWLAALETKTAGNLSSEEGAFLSDLVFQLRAAYLQSRR
jgi:hypothetical protein